jgi:hypothetical protein
MDLTTLTLIAVALFGLVVGDSVLYGNTLSVVISVPPKLVETGFTEAAAEYTFLGEASRITYVNSAIPTPELRVRSVPSMASILTKPLGLEGLTGSLAITGASKLWVAGAMMVNPAGKGLELAMMVAEPDQAAQEIRITQEDGDPIALVRRGADLALEELSPYRVALAQYATGIVGDAAALAQARDTVTRDLARPWVPAKASERAMEQNLLALLALLTADLTAAQQELGKGASMSGVGPAARAIINLNRAFVAVALKQPAQAREFSMQAMQTTNALTVPDIEPRINALNALVLWSNGDLAGAEQLLRHAVADRPDDEGAHTYLSQLLAAKGDAAGSAAEQRAATASHTYDPHIMDLAQSVVWTDPVNGGVRPRT